MNERYRKYRRHRFVFVASSRISTTKMKKKRFDSLSVELREHELPPPDADLPTAPASDVPTPSTFAEAESSEHAALWRDSRTREFRGLLQADTFGPA